MYTSQNFRKVESSEVKLQVDAMESGSNGKIEAGKGENAAFDREKILDRRQPNRGVAAGYFPAPDHVANIFFVSNTQAKELPDSSVLDALQSMCASESCAVYCPNESPKNGTVLSAKSKWKGKCKSYDI